LPRPVPLAALRDTVDRLLRHFEAGSSRQRGERLSALQIDASETLGASLTARATAGETQLDLLLEEHTVVDALGGEHRAFLAHVMLDVVPGITVLRLGHAPPGRPCSELELEAVAMEWSGHLSRRAVLAVARALAYLGEDVRAS
jgi:hypothetical protein